MQPSRYSFAEYSPDWPLAFEREAKLWAQRLGDHLLAIHHVGSTAVPGLAAKPVIDLLPVVRQIEVVDSFTESLEADGYRPWGEYGLAGRRLFTKEHEGTRTHNVHIYGEGNEEIERHVAFCEYLKRHPQACDEYARLKRAVYAQHPADIAAYNDGKAAWIQALEPIALKWFRSQT